MKARYLWVAAILLGSWVQTLSVFAAAAPSPSLMKAKQEAEAKGYVFFTNHEEIVAQAKKEGKLRVLSTQEPASIKAIASAFKQKYPFIDVRAEDVMGMENYQLILQEMKAGLAKSWDVNYVAFDFYSEFLPYQKKFDFLGMAQYGVLKMPANLVDPVNRHIVALQSNAQVVAYNKELISPDRVPSTWENFLKPEFSDRKLATDVRPKVFAALVPAWGLEKTLDFAKKLASQQPIWLRGDAQIITFLMTGQFPIALGQNYKTFVRVQKKDVKGVLGLKVVEPIPVRLSETQGVLATGQNPHAGLLWLEFQAGPEGQKILDEIDLAASIFSPGSAHEQLARGKKVSVLAWEHYLKMARYEEEIVKALGFPRAEKK
ncbi:MAG: ABC transporter substrate-binding protein [Deltaproteobacteria bacterium]|nr:ABC transporter substrate-binding protein [Deltaproteobacteria bacterium]